MKIAIYEAGAAAMVALFAFQGCGGGDDSPADYVGNGMKALEARNYAEAVDNLSVAVKEDPGDVDAHVGLVEAYIKHGEVEKAAAAAKTALELAPEATGPILAEGYAAFAQKKPDYNHAIACFTKVAEDSSRPASERAMAYNARAVAIKTSDPARTDHVRLDLFRALQLNPRNEAAHYHLGLLYIDSFPAEALEEFNLFIRYKGSDPRHVETVEKDIIPGLKRVLKENEAERLAAASSRDESAAAQAIRAARKYRASRRFERASDNFALALKKDPLSVSAALEYAAMLEEMAQVVPSRLREKRSKAYVKALETYRAAIKACPPLDAVSLRKACIGAARCATASGRPKTAVECLERLLAMNRSDRDALILMAQAQSRRGPAFKSISADYEKLAEQAPARRRR